MVIHSREEEVAVVLKGLGSRDNCRVREHVDLGIKGDKFVVEVVESCKDHLKFGGRVGGWFWCRGRCQYIGP